MRIVVLGGCGGQRRTALFDLAADENVTEIIFLAAVMGIRSALG